MKTLLILGGCGIAVLAIAGVGAVIAVVATHIHQAYEEFY